MKKTKRILMALLAVFAVMGVKAQIGVVDGNVTYVVQNGSDKAEAQVASTWNGFAAVPVQITGELTIKSEITINGTSYQVYKIANYGFQNQTGITSVNLNGVTVIGEGAFKGCTSIQTADLSNVTSIGSLAFYECTKLETITLGNATRGSNAFYGTNITTLNIAAGVTTVPANVASGFTGTLTTVNLASGTTAIGNSAFTGCSRLSTINNPADAYDPFVDIKEIGKNAFNGCSSLTGELWLNLTTLGEGAFAGTGYETVNVQGIQNLPANVFNQCAKLKSAQVKNLKTIGAKAFYFCPLTSFQFTNVTSIGAEAFAHANLNEEILEFSEILTSIGAGAFTNTNISSAIFKSNPEIGTGAFRNASILTLEISDVTELNYNNTNTYGKVTYTRNMTQSVTGNRKYAGLILPFVPVANEDYVFYQLNSSSNSTEVVFDRVDSPAANTPYLFEYLGSAGAVTFVSDGAVTIGGSHTHEFTAGSWKATGVYNKQAKTSNGKLYSIKGGEFTRYENNLTVNPYRVYWTAPTTNAIKFRNGSDDVTEVEFAEIEDVNIPATYYDLTGRRVLEPVKGNLYIVNGKKVVY